MTKRLLSWLLVFVMVLGMLPAQAYAHDHDHEAHVHAAAEIQATITMNALATKGKLYTWIDGVKGDTDLLSGVTASDKAYQVSLAPGEYVLEG